MKALLNTLYVTNPDAYMRLEGETICVELEREKVLQVPLHHVGSVVCFGDVMVTPAALHRCVSDGKSITFLSRQGYFTARVEGSVSGNVLLRIDQHKAYHDRIIALNYARNIVAGKLQNCRQIVLRGARESANQFEANKLQRTASIMAALIAKLKESETLDELRGLEGEGAKLHFDSLNWLIKEDKREGFEFKRRSRRPPLDALNALLSFLYTLVLVDCRAALEAVGLDPQIGFLHAVRAGRPSLALDLMEEFRPILADRLAISLINRGQVKQSDFENFPGGAVYLTADGRKAILVAYQKRKQEELMHPLLKDQIQLGIIPHLQSRLLARAIRGDMDTYLPFVYR